MIERQKIDGREATVAYMDDKFNPAPKDKATLVKLRFDDGQVLFLTPLKTQ